jgi:hypothetical protein
VDLEVSKAEASSRGIKVVAGEVDGVAEEGGGSKEDLTTCLMRAAASIRVE